MTVDAARRVLAVVEWAIRHDSAFRAASRALDPDGYPTGGDRRGRGVADPTGHAAQAPKPGREAQRRVDAAWREVVQIIERRIEDTMRLVLDQVPPVEPDGERCMACGTYATGAPNDRLRSVGVAGARWCDACRNAWARRAGSQPLAEFVAERRDRAAIRKRRMPA